MGSPVIFNGTNAKFLTSGIIIPGSTSGLLTLKPNASTTSYTINFPAAQGGSGTTLSNDGAGNLTWATFGSGTVTSVALTVPSFLSVAGSPVTSSGTLAVSYSGTALPVANGGTGQTSFTSNYLLTGNGTSGLGTISTAFSGTALVSNGTSASFSSTVTLGGSGTAANGSLVLNGVGSGAVTIRPQAAAGTYEFDLPITAGSAGQVLTSQGGAGTAMTWTTPTTGTVTSVAATVPSLLSVSGSPITTSGTLAFTYSGTPLPILNGGTGQTTKSAAFNALSPITATGDLIVGNGVNSATNLAIGTTGQVLTVAGGTATWAAAAASTGPSAAYVTQNLGLSVSVASNAMTIRLKQADGSTDPASGSGAVSIDFRSSTATTGSYSAVSVTSALSIVIPSGATLGQTSAVNQYVWVYAINNGGTVDLCVSGVSLFTDKSIQSTTAITSGSTSGSVLYSNSAYSSLPIRLIGRLLVNEATAGTWASNTTDIVLNPTPYPTMTDWASYSLSITATTSNPTMGTIVINQAYWRRVGGNLEINFTYLQSTGGTSGTGTYLYSLPNSYTIDTTKIINASPYALGSPGVGTCGAAYVSNGSGSAFAGAAVVQAYSSTALCLSYCEPGSANTIYFASSTGATFATSNILNSFSASVPIAGWSTYGP